MGFVNLTGSVKERKKVARVFFRPQFSDLECDAIVTGKVIPATGGWVQIKTADGGAGIYPKRTTSKLGNQQDGDTVKYQDKLEFQLKVTVSAMQLPLLQDVLILDPSVSSSSDVLWFRANMGMDITDKAVSVMVYDKKFDPTNGSNTPDIDADPEAIIVFKASPADDVPAIVLNNNQQTAEITFDCLASTSAGSSSGVAGGMGSFDELV